MRDIVLDTNVLAHSQNYRSERFQASFSLLTRIMESGTYLCLDNEFAADDDCPSGSLIGFEYKQHLRGQSAGSAFVSFMLQNRRFKVVGVSLPRGTHRWIVQNISRTRDRTFVRVACNSEEKVFVTHDFEDFSPRVRRTMRRKLALFVCEAGTCPL